MIELIGKAQDAGTKYKGVQHDAVAAGALPANIRTAGDAQRYLEDIMENVSDNADRVANSLEAKQGLKHFSNGSTVTVAVVTPDGFIVHANLGDSPLMVFAYDKVKGTVKGSGILNTLHNPDPFSTNVIDEVAGKQSVRNLIGDKSGRYQGRTEISNITFPGEKIVIAPVSDGMFDGVGNAPKHLNKADAKKWVIDKNTARLKQYDTVVEQVLIDGGNPQDIADSLVKSSYDIAGNKGRDNISAVAAIIDPDDLPKQSIAMMVADGNGQEGHRISTAVKESFESKLSTSNATPHPRRSANVQTDINSKARRIRGRTGGVPTPRDIKMLETVKNQLGSDIMALNIHSSGDVHITVPDTTSRGIFRKLGISKNQIGRSAGSLPNTAVVIIPANQLPSSWGTASIKTSLVDTPLGVVDNGLHATTAEIDDIAKEIAHDVEQGISGSSWTDKLSSPWVQVGIGAAVGVGTVLFTNATWEEGVGVAFQTAMPFGEVVTELTSGDITGAINASATEFSGMTGAVFGAKAGAGLGTWIGGTVGAFFGGVGAVPGAAIGGVVGSVLGGMAGGIGASIVMDYTMNEVPIVTATIKNIGEGALEYAGVNTDKLAENYKTTTSYLVAGKDYAFSAIDSGYETLAGLFNNEAGVGVNETTLVASTDNVISDVSNGKAAAIGSNDEFTLASLQNYPAIKMQNMTTNEDNIVQQFDSYKGNMALLQEALDKLGLNIDPAILKVQEQTSPYGINPFSGPQTFTV